MDEGLALSWIATTFDHYTVPTGYGASLSSVVVRYEDQQVAGTSAGHLTA
jgi:hypothetical protein